MTSDAALFPHPLRVADLSQRRPTRFALKPDRAARQRIIEALGLVALDELAFTGDLRAEGRKDWLLEARLNARVTQSCVVTLAPVTTAISEDVRRRFVADLPEPEGDEIEMPEDDTVEPLRDVIDAGAAMIEALTLSLPLYPRAEGAELGRASFAGPDVEPLSDEALKPFAGLADLMKKGDGKG